MPRSWLLLVDLQPLADPGTTAVGGPSALTSPASPLTPSILSPPPPISQISTPLFFLISQFYFHFSFCLLPFTRSLLWFLTLFSTWHSSSLKQVPSFPVQQISPCRSFLFLTSPLPPIYRIRILLYFTLVVTSHLFLII